MWIASAAAKRLLKNRLQPQCPNQKNGRTISTGGHAAAGLVPLALEPYRLGAQTPEADGLYLQPRVAAARRNGAAPPTVLSGGGKGLRT